MVRHLLLLLSIAAVLTFSPSVSCLSCLGGRRVSGGGEEKKMSTEGSRLSDLLHPYGRRESQDRRQQGQGARGKGQGARCKGQGGKEQGEGQVAYGRKGGCRPV